MRQILFLAALLLLCNVAQANAAGDTSLASAATIQSCASCGDTADNCGCEKPKCGCEKKEKCGCEKKEKCGCEKKEKCGCQKKEKCGCEKPKCGCSEKKSCGCEKQEKCGCEQKKSCGCEKEKDCGCISNEIAYGDGLAYSLVSADSMSAFGLAYTMVDMVSEPLDPNCCLGETFCLLDNCTACYTLSCCPDPMRLLCKDKCGKQKCSSCGKCADKKCGCDKPKCGCARQKCSGKCGCS